MSRQEYHLGAIPFVDLIFYSLKACRTNGFIVVKQPEVMERCLLALETTCCWFVIYYLAALSGE
jgi:hypothetical protein